MLQAKSDGYQVISLDEVIFSSRSIIKREFSNQHTNICIDRNQTNIKCTAVIAAASEEKGLIHWKCFDKSVNVQKYMEFLQELTRKFYKKKIAIFCDNLSVHHNKGVKAYLQQKGVRYLFNCAYFPDGNMIETLFSKVKRHFYRMKTNEIVNGGRTPTRALIDRSFGIITREECVKAAHHALKCFEP